MLFDAALEKAIDKSLFQTKLTYGMICYNTRLYIIDTMNKAFQTKLTYGMICYNYLADDFYINIEFQTKLTYGMICYFVYLILFFALYIVSN